MSEESGAGVGSADAAQASGWGGGSSSGVGSMDAAQASSWGGSDNSSVSTDNGTSLGDVGGVVSDVAADVGGGSNYGGGTSAGVGSHDAAQASAWGGSNASDSGVGSHDAAQASQWGGSDTDKDDRDNDRDRGQSHAAAGIGSHDAAQAAAWGNTATAPFGPDDVIDQMRSDAAAAAVTSSLGSYISMDTAVDAFRAGRPVDRPAPTTEADRIIAENSAAYRAGLLGTVEAREYRERDIAGAVLGLAATDPEHAAAVTEALMANLPPAEAELVGQMIEDRLADAQTADVVLGSRVDPFDTRAVDPAEARAAASQVMAESYRTTAWGDFFGHAPQLDAEALAEGLLDLRAVDPDLAVAARRDLVSRIGPERAAAVDDILADAPSAPGAATVRPTEGWANYPMLSSILGDTAAVVMAPFRDDGLAVNPLSGHVLTGRALLDAKVFAVFDGATLGMGTTIARGLRVGAEAFETLAPVARTPAAGLLPTEGTVGTYADLSRAGTVGDNITPHHIPSANHMEGQGVAHADGIAINMEQPVPGIGGRHRETFTYGTRADTDLDPRDALAANIRDLRSIYQEHGLYNDWMRDRLREVIEQNRTQHPEVFGR